MQGVTATLRRTIGYARPTNYPGYAFRLWRLSYLSQSLLVPHSILAMKNSFPFRFLSLATVASLFALVSCSKTDTPAPTPVPDTGSVLFVNAAASTPVGIKIFANNDEKTTLTYGLNNGGATAVYQTVPAGTSTIKVDNAAAAGTNFFSQGVTVVKDQKYSYFVYSTSTDANTAPTGKLFSDDLTAPTTGKAKIRLVNIAYGFPNPAAAISLSQSQPIGFLPITSAVNASEASNFVEINPGPANLLITTGTSPTGTTVGTVGDGTGAGTGAMGTGTKNYEAGKIYTIVVRGTAGNPDPARQPKAFIIQNN